MVGMIEVERVCKRCRRAKVYSITLALAAAKGCGLKFRYYVLLLSYPRYTIHTVVSYDTFDTHDYEKRKVT